MGVGNTTDTSTEQNPCELIQLWISFNCQNPSDENHPLGRSLSDDFVIISSPALSAKYQTQLQQKS